MRVVFIPVFIFLILLPFSVSATTYYVSQVDGDDSYNGLYPTYQGGSDGPWLTLGKSVSDVSSGDTVYLRGGTWQDEQLYIGYKNYNSTTTWKAYPGETPVIDMRNSGTTEATAPGIFCKGTDYVYIDGITVRNSGHDAIRFQGCDHTKVINCTTEHSRRAGIYMVVLDDFEVAYNTVKWTQCHHADHDHDEWTARSEECISIAQASNGEVHHNSVSHGTEEYQGGEGINVKNGCSYIYVHHNIVDQARDDGVESTRYCMGVDGWTLETHHIYFYNNIVMNGSWGIQFNSEEGGYTHHIYAWNNIIIHCGHGMMHGGGIGFPRYGGNPGLCEHMYWWNNIIYDCYYGFRGDKEELGTDIFVQNNIFSSSTQADTYFPVSDPADITFDHNLFSETDPKFVDASGGDFHLQSDSPAIDAGFDFSGFFTDDYDGNTRPVDGDSNGSAEFDIGAFEYGGSPSNCTGTCKTNPCDTYDDCANGTGTCVTGYCCSGACSLCPNGNCESGETCSSCPSDCTCVSPQLCCNDQCITPACSQESDCGSDPCIIYTCNNPGTCSASCSSQDITSCTNDDGCCPSGCDEGNDNDCGALDPVALYHFDEGFGFLASDSSGNGNGGTVYGANWTTDSVSGNALEFDGVDDCVEANDSESLNISQTVTITAWINPSSISSWDRIAAKSHTSDTYPYTMYGLLFDDANHIRLEIATGGTQNIVNGLTVIPTNEWTFVAGTYDGSSLNLYVNGSLDNSALHSGNIDTNNMPLSIGRSGFDSNYFNGTIDEVRIYDRALTEGEILQLYNNPGGESIPGDINNPPDGVVDILDLTVVANDFGKTSNFDDPDSDTDGNGEVDIFDVVFVASRFT